MKRTHAGAVSPLLIGLIVVGVAIFAILGSLFSLYLGGANYGAKMDNEVEFNYKNNEQILGQYGQKISEMAQIPSMLRDDVAKVLTGAIGARYGANGSQASMQWIKEQNPSLDSAVYVKLQQTIEAGRNEFQNAQTRLLDVCRSYKTKRDMPWDGFWINLAGFPKISDIDKKCTPISTDYAAKAFADGKESGPIKLR